jgi:MFS family permease
VTITNREESESATAVDAPSAGRGEWIGLAVLALANLLYVIDLTVLKLAVPAISADLAPTGAQLLWIIDIYGFFVAGSLITMGTLGDRIGPASCCSSAPPPSAWCRCWRRSPPAPSC